jgi:hypothetical protein
VGTIPFMVFGADVTHPTSFNPDDPSIAAVTASYDRTLGRYMSRVLRQVRSAESVAEETGALSKWCAEVLFVWKAVEGFLLAVGNACTHRAHMHVLLLPVAALPCSPLQGHRQEVIGAMQEVVMDMLKEFHRRNNGRKPQALIYYRDGVADSQFPTVLEHEYTAFRKVRRRG